MSRYFRLCSEPNDAAVAPPIVIAANQLKFDPPLEDGKAATPFTLGRAVHPQPEVIPITIKGDGPIKRLLVGSAVFLDSRIAETIQRAFPEEIQIFKIAKLDPARVMAILPPQLKGVYSAIKSRNERPASDDEYDTLRLINITKALDCIDYAKSEIIFRDDNPNEIDCLHKLVLDSSKIGPADHIFRLVNRMTLVIVSDTTRQVLTDAGIPAACFASDVF